MLIKTFILTVTVACVFESKFCCPLTCHPLPQSLTSGWRSLSLPARLQQRIRKYHAFLAVHHNQGAYSALFSGLGVNLSIELKQFLFRKLIADAPFFKDLSHRGFHATVSPMAPRAPRVLALLLDPQTGLHKIFAQTPSLAHLWSRVHGRSTASLRALLLSFQETVFAPGDIVIRKGDVGREMFFIVRGSVEVPAERSRYGGSGGTEGHFGDLLTA